MNLTYPYRLCTHIRGYHALLTEIKKIQKIDSALLAQEL